MSIFNVEVVVVVVVVVVLYISQRARLLMSDLWLNVHSRRSSARTLNSSVGYFSILYFIMCDCEYTRRADRLE